MKMKRAVLLRMLLTFTLVGMLSASVAGGSGLKAAEVIRVFDGKTLEGWEGDTTHTWRVEEEAIVAGSLETSVPRNEFLCLRENYGDFILALEYKIEGTEGFVNGGIQIRSERIPNHHEMIGYQADGGAGYDGALYDESRRNKFVAKPEAEVLKATLKPGEWNRYLIRCEGARITLELNGVKTVDYLEADDSIPRTGKIAMQIHGAGKTVVRYRNITVQRLGAK